MDSFKQGGTVAVCLLLLLSPALLEGRECRPDLIPNGKAVDKLGCINCHITSDGGTKRNVFGNRVRLLVNEGSCLEFWSAELAMEDSDGDGFTNGEELQDPDGTWVSGAPNPGDPGRVSNPGQSDSTPQEPTPSLTPSPTPEPTETPSPTPTPVINEASFVGVSAPAPSIVGQDFLIGISFRNTGNTTWVADHPTNPYLLAVQGDPCGLLGGATRISMGAGALAEPGGIYQFNVRITTPSSPMDCTLQVQMIQELVQFFGPITDLNFSVIVPPNDARDWTLYD